MTVLAALRRELPGADFVYLGDTARVPYGTKSPASVVRYSLQCADALMMRGIRCLVVACNTASASALEALRLRFPGLYIAGVIEPGASAAVALTHTRHVAVIGTEGTIGGGAYQRAIQGLNSGIRVSACACSLFVALAEEGWLDGPIADEVARRYLAPLFPAEPAQPADVLVLGCTHFPVLASAIRAALPPAVRIVDSAATVAAAVARKLAAPRLSHGPGKVTWLATDGAARFARVGSLFLGEPVHVDDIEIVDL